MTSAYQSAHYLLKFGQLFLFVVHAAVVCLDLLYGSIIDICAGESVSVLKFVDVVNDLRAVNQDKKNILFSVCNVITYFDE
jgi:hypothetical protein